MAKAKGTGKLNRKKTTPGTGVTATDRATDILSILELVKFARGESLRLGLEFEAYLLDMAALELANQFERTESAVGRISRQCSRSKT